MSDNKNFSSTLEVEHYLNANYSGKVVTVQYANKNGLQEYTGKVDRIAIDDLTRNPPVVILVFPGKRIEVDRDEFFQNVKLLN